MTVSLTYLSRLIKELSPWIGATVAKVDQRAG
jgi:hypothetical protein